MLTKPNKLEIGDTIGIIAPSGSLASLVPHRLEAAKKNLENLGFKVKLFPTTKLNDNGNAGTIGERIKDIHDAFLDKKVKAIICATGGISNNQLISKIDYNIIKENPKIFVGYSDTTILHYAFQKKAELVTFYGPCAITQFGEFPDVLEYTKNSFINTLVEGRTLGKIEPSEEWTSELLDWFQKLDLTRSRKLGKNSGYKWLKPGSAKANIVGGCLHSIAYLIGTDIDLDYTDKILFIETPEGKDFTKGEPIPYVEAQIVDLKNKGIFNKIKGLIVGRPFGYSDEEKTQFEEIIKEHLKEYNFPILINVDIGHTDPIITLPLGVNVTINSEENTFSIDESGVI
ncbi:MAG TPA: LD-carboxypeptidase [Candidatus Pacearchaeota archaeon]|nr:putative murein peptide carboxypeptidase [archaeon BMS3Abin17]HDK41816.1 LD-carboxypeptidase [Candidatus Pacearchaeota archaeon]HDZ60897.1 LD-carboxypeptidase [Candidatus Pacearchaeota archaeon]